MAKRLTTRELIQASVMELMQTVSQEKLTVRQICVNCNITTTSFYNYFQDKNDVVCSIVKDAFAPAVLLPLDQWAESVSHFLTENPVFFKNAPISVRSAGTFSSTA